MSNVIPDPGFREAARPFGEIAMGIVEKLRPADVDDTPLELVCERKLKEAGFAAHDRGATISIIRCGFHVRKGCRSEIVRFDQLCGDVLLRALERVAPHAWESLGLDRP